MVRSLYISCIISGKNPIILVLNNAPFGVQVTSAGFRRDKSCCFCNNSLTDFSESNPIVFGRSVSGEILYCIIRCGYREFKSKDRTHLCCPTCGSLTYAPTYLSLLLSLLVLEGITIFFLRRWL